MKRIINEVTSMTWGEYINSVKKFPSNTADIEIRYFSTSCEIKIKDVFIEHTGGMIDFGKNGDITPAKSDSVVHIEYENAIRIFNPKLYSLTIYFKD